MIKEVLKLLHAHQEGLLLRIRDSDVDSGCLELLTVAYIDEIKTKIRAGEVDPKEDWHRDIVPPVRKTALEEEVDYHHLAALRQIAYVQVLFDHVDLAFNNEQGLGQERKLTELTEHILTALQWGFAHWAGYNVVRLVRDRKYAGPAVKGGQAKAKKRDESQVLLSCLVRSQLEKKRPVGGWRNVHDTAKAISGNLLPLIREHNFPLTNDEYTLRDQIQNLINEPKGELSSVYKQFCS